MREPKKFPRMTKRAKEIARETVREELRARKVRGRTVNRRQAVAVGLSRAREQAELERALGIAEEYGLGYMQGRGAS